MKKGIIISILMFMPLSLFAANEPNTYNNDFSINLPDRAEDLRDILPLPNSGMFGSQIISGVSEIPTKYAHRTVIYNEKGFNKTSYHPYSSTITVSELLKIETVTILAGTTLYFFNNSSRPLLIESSDTTLELFGMKEEALRSREPIYSYHFKQPGRFTLHNKLKLYQQIIIDVKDPNEKDVCIIRDTYTKNGIIQEKEYRAAWCDVPRDLSTVAPIVKKEEEAKKEDFKMEKEKPICIQVLTPARNKINGEVKWFQTPCDIPQEWEQLPFDYKIKEKKSLKNEVKKQNSEKKKQGSLPIKFNHLKGRILLQVQAHGEAWYVHPKSGERLSLGRPADAFTTMKKAGLGISNADFKRLFGNIPDHEGDLKVMDTAMAQKLAGAILLKVESNGEAYYLDPVSNVGHYLGRPSDAFTIMKKLSVGISDDELSLIPH